MKAMRTYWRPNDSDTWHYAGCSHGDQAVSLQQAADDYTFHRGQQKPRSGELCDEARAKARVAGRPLQ